MEKRKWLWKRKSSEKSLGETESSGSISSHSERNYDDQQEASKESPNHNTQSPEVTSKAAVSGEEVNEASKESPNHNTQSPEVTSKAAVNGEEVNVNVKSLTEKLSAALCNVSAKEDLVKQHAKVAEEAVAGWEKSENEVVVLKQQLEAAVQQNSALEDRVSHLDGALRECVRQLRQARDEQEQKIHEAVEKKTRDWETIKFEHESQILRLQTQVEASKAESPAFGYPDILHRLESLEKENSALKFELLSRSEELEIMAIERDLSTQAAETASKQHLESIKKVAKLEAECLRLKAVARKSSSVNDHKSVAASSFYVESLTDSQSDSGEQEIATRKMSSLEPNECEPSCSDSWASALITELDQFKNEKAVNRNLSASVIEIDLMDDFLEMERLAALPETKSGTRCIESEPIVNQSINGESPLRAKLEAMIDQTTELEEKLEKMEAEKAEVETALTKSQDWIKASQVQLGEAEMKLEQLQRELNFANESKQFFESQLIGMEVEVRTMSAKVDSLEAEVEQERALSAEIAVKCRELEDELSRKKQEVELQQTASSNGELKITQEDLAVAAGKLVECQKTIASLGKQLKSLATLEDFLIDTANLPQLSGGGSLTPTAGEEVWKLHSNDTFLPKTDLGSLNIAGESTGPSVNGNDGNSLASSSSSTSSLNHVSSEKSRNGFVKLFSRSKGGIQLQSQ